MSITIHVKVTPDRLTSNINDLHFVLSFRILSFGAGRKNCVGEVLAKNRIFLFFTCLFQKFKFLPSKEEHAPIHDSRTYRFAINDYDK